jgi:hypothetical protein
MVWECRERRECECRYFACDCTMDHLSGTPGCSAEYDIGRSIVVPETHQEVFERWLKIFNEFTKLDIGYELDRLLAISGTVSLLSEKLHSPYTAVVWQYELGHGLMWRRLPDLLSRRVHVCPVNMSLAGHGRLELLSRKAKDCTHHRAMTSRSIGIVCLQVAVLQHAKSNRSLRIRMVVFRSRAWPCPALQRLNVKSGRIFIRPISPTSQEERSSCIRTLLAMTAPQKEAKIVCLLVGARSTERFMAWRDDSRSDPCIIRYALMLQSDLNGV